MSMETLTTSTLQWQVSGLSSMNLSGFDEEGGHVAEVECKNTGLWRFHFTDYQGTGTVRVGPGCNDNPVHMVETLREFLLEGREHRLITYADELQWDSDFQEEHS